MQAAASDITHRYHRGKRQLPFHRQVPVPRFGILEGLALRGYGQGKEVGGSAAGVIHAAAGHIGRRLERRVAAQEDRVTHTQAGDEAARAGANDGLIVDAVRDTNARLEVVPLDIAVARSEEHTSELQSRQYLV